MSGYVDTEPGNTTSIKKTTGEPRGNSSTYGMGFDNDNIDK